MARAHRLIYAVFFLSGAAGLGYELVWTRMFLSGLGHEYPSTLAVLAAWFGGFALGAALLDGVVSRSSRPGRWYAGLEALAGLWALATLALVPACNRLVPSLAGADPGPLRHVAVSFLVPGIVLLPATICLGATLPAMDRFLSRLRGDGRSVGLAYGVNTAGAVAGVLLVTHLVLPWLGFRLTLLALAGVSLLCAGAVAAGLGRGEEARPPVSSAMEDPVAPGRLSATLFFTGLLGIGFEILGVRVMRVITESTVYSFASALAVYLVATAAGAALWQRLGRDRGFRHALAWLLAGLSLSVVLGTVMLALGRGLYEGMADALGRGKAAGIGAELALGMAVFALPALFMGATFTHLAQAARRGRGGVGRALAVNTLGGALAPLVFGVLLLPALGARWSLGLAALGYALLLPRRPSPALAAAFAPLLLLLFLPSRLVSIDLPGKEGRLVAYREGVSETVSVVSDETGGRYLKVGNRFYMGGTTGAFGMGRLAHVPLLLHPGPRDVLFLGVGTGITMNAARAHPGVRVQGVELVPDIADMMVHFVGQEDAKALPVALSDARRYVAATDRTFDVVVADLFHPARDGAGALYTVEHFQAVRDRLNEGGLFCQWLPLHQMDLETLRMVIAGFLEVFPRAAAFLAHYNVETPCLGLVGSDHPLGLLGTGWNKRVQDPTLARALYETALDRPLALVGCFLASREELAAFSRGAPRNRDDHPVVTFWAPRFSYQRNTTWGRLTALLRRFSGDPAPLLPRGRDAAVAALQERARRYLAARNRFVEGSVSLARGDRAGAQIALLESLATSPDFDTAYVVLLDLARTLWPGNPNEARAILFALDKIRPGNPAARLTREQLESMGR